MAKKKSVKKTSKKAAKKTSKKAVKKSSQRSSSSSNNQTLAIIALIINLIFMPGLGTLIGGKTREGIWQLVLFWVGVLLIIVLVGIPIVIVAWIWGIVSGVRLIQESS